MRLLIRADASPRIGAGHVMRCLALAQAWRKKDRQVTFLTGGEAPSLAERLRREGMEVTLLAGQPGGSNDAAQTVNLARQLEAAWVVVDGYCFGANFQRSIKDAGFNLLHIDDEGGGIQYYADLLLNQNIHAHEGLYEAREAYTRLLLGPRYALLRREFCLWKGWRREIPVVARKILVTLGGGDSDNVTGLVVRALGEVKGASIEAMIIAGGANPFVRQLEEAVNSLPFSARLERNVANMPELMAWADVAITAGGSTCWETAFMGLPSLIIVLMDNQRPVAMGLAAAGVAKNLGVDEYLAKSNLIDALHRLLADQTERSEMSHRGQILVDGEGPARVLKHMLSQLVWLRPVRSADCRMIWEWANEHEARASSFSTAPITWESHEKWFMDRLSDPNHKFYIALDDSDIPLGQVRFAFMGEEATISVSVDKQYRSQGYGINLIHLGCDKLFAETPVTLVHAYIKENNPRSLKVFLEAGFTYVGLVTVHEQTALHCQFRREARAV